MSGADIFDCVGRFVGDWAQLGNGLAHDLDLSFCRVSPAPCTESGLLASMLPRYDSCLGVPHTRRDMSKPRAKKGSQMLQIQG